ncbi:MAG: agmatine deiminase family protein [Planctomycetales bacterium]|nr:agmatine deiminase family protein [Planctomycetales bacterium]
MSTDKPAALSPRSLGYRWPAEWEPHASTWLSWPHNRDTWPGVFDDALQEFIQFTRAIAEYEPVNVLASGAAADSASSAVGNYPNITIHDVPTNDAWIRDHGPTFLTAPDASLPKTLIDWKFNSWGGKYPPFDNDNRVPMRVAEILGRRRFANEIVLEGGAIDGNGAGTVLTTESCVLSDTRNEGLTKSRFESLLSEQLGADEIIWLEGDVPGDDTDGHVDQIARFVSEKVITIAVRDDLPQLAENRDRIAQKRPDISVVDLPMPSQIFLGDQYLPASYANFYIVNRAVLVPQFGDVLDKTALSILSDLFPAREVIGLPARWIVGGLGAFHCMTQQECA